MENRLDVAVRLEKLKSIDKSEKVISNAHTLGGIMNV